MKDSSINRRKFIKYTTAAAASMGLLSTLPQDVFASAPSLTDERTMAVGDRRMKVNAAPRARFSVIGINHNHIYSQVDAAIRGGGELVSLYAKEADLVADFKKRYPQVKVAASEKEALEDKSVQLILSSAIPVERAAIGIRV